jgi:hypothetical protein
MNSEPRVVDVTDQVDKKETSARKIRVIFGIPGNSFSDKFLICWSAALVNLLKTNKYDFLMSPGYSSFVSFARMKTLGLDVLRGHDQKPFGEMEYDVFLTIDSDMVFNYEQIETLIQSALQKKVVSGMYLMADGEHLATVKEWDNEFFVKNGTFQFLTSKDVEEYKNAENTTDKTYMEVSYSGMGFFACTKEVLDALEYPYFWHPLIEIQGPEGKLYRDQCSEDVAFCRNIQAKGFKIYLHTSIKTGHEKTVVF